MTTEVNNVFEENPAVDDNDIVGEGKKFKTTEDALRSIPFKDQHILKLESEAKDLRNEIASRLTIEAQLRKAMEAKPRVEQPPAREEPAQQVQDLPNLDEKIKSAVTQYDEARRFKDNAETVASKLIETLGGEKQANDFVLSKAKELGVSTEWLRDVAARTPKAFFSTVGLEVREVSNSNPNASKSKLNTAALQSNPGGPKEGTYSWFMAKKSENPAWFSTMKAQKDLMAAAMKHGEGFTKT